MEKKLDAKEARVQIWEELLRVAKPDSKFSWQFSEFICDYEGSEKGTALLTATDMYKNARVIFITPDNNLETLREQAFRDKKTVVMTNYGITRGFFLIRPGQIPEGKEEIASLLDVDVTVEDYDTAIDYIVTPTRLIETRHEYPRPSKGIIWSRLAPGMREQIPPIQELWCKVHCK